MVEAGKKIPWFSLEADDGAKVASKDLAGTRFVLFIYPKASTSGWTTEAIDFRDEIDTFRKKKVGVVGLSKDTVKAQRSFKEKNKLPFPLLADPDQAFLKALGVIQPKNMYGKKVLGVVRSTILVGPDGLVEKVWSPVKVAGHVAEVLGAL